MSYQRRRLVAFVHRCPKMNGTGASVCTKSLCYKHLANILLDVRALDGLAGMVE